MINNLIQYKKELILSSNNKLIHRHILAMIIILMLLPVLGELNLLHFIILANDFWQNFYFLFSISIISSIYFSSTIGYLLFKIEKKQLKYYLNKSYIFDKLFMSKILVIWIIISTFQFCFVSLGLFVAKTSIFQINSSFILTEFTIIFTTNLIFLVLTLIMVLLMKDFNNKNQISYKNIFNFLVLLIFGISVVIANTLYMKQVYHLLQKNIVLIYTIADIILFCELFMLIVILPILYSWAKKRFLLNY